jgi:hypothetical protein
VAAASAGLRHARAVAPAEHALLYLVHTRAYALRSACELLLTHVLTNCTNAFFAATTFKFLPELQRVIVEAYPQLDPERMRMQAPWHGNVDPADPAASILRDL